MITHKEKILFPICRQHFGGSRYFQWQQNLYRLEAVLNRKLKGFLDTRLLATRLLECFCKMKFTPFTYAQKIPHDGNYIHFGQDCLDIQIKHVSRPSLIISPGQEISTSIRVEDDSIFWYGLGLLENLDPKVLNGALVVNIAIGDSPQESMTYKLLLNPRMKRTYEGFYKYGNSWADCHIDLNAFIGRTLDLTLRVSFEEEGKPVPVFSKSCVALAAPQVVIKRTKSKARRIIVLLCEAMTDPLFLQEYHKTKAEMPHYKGLLEDSISIKRSYSQNDSTISSVGTILTGLYGSQHGIKDYRSMPLHYEVPVLSNAVKTVPEILKEHSFLTIGGSACARLHPAYGWSRGFDYYHNAPLPWSNDAPDAAWAKRALDTMEGFDGFLFLYLDWLHWPTITFPHYRSPSCYSINELKDASNEEITVPHYMRCLNRLDRQIGEIVGFLKDRGVYDNTLLMLTGDHGSYLPPWGYHERYAFYERHIRAPFVAKMPSWAAQEPKEKCRNLGSASLEVSRTIMRTLGFEYPDYYSTLPQYKEESHEYAITETLMHPTPDAYAISIVSENYKYVMFAKINWDTLTFIGVDGERLYRVNPHTGHVDEDAILMDDKMMTPEVSAVREKYSEIAKRFIETNLEFQKQHPTYHFRTGAVGWQPKRIGPVKKHLSVAKGLLRRAWT